MAWEEEGVGRLARFCYSQPTISGLFSHSELQDPAQRSRCVRDLVRTLPAPNHDTLRLLIQHLCR